MSTLFNMAVLLSLNAGGFHAGMSAAGNALTQMAAKAANSQAAVDRLAMSMKALAAGAVITVPLGSADVPESCSFRALVSIDSLPLSRPRAIKSAENARIYTPHLKVFRQ